MRVVLAFISGVATTREKKIGVLTGVERKMNIKTADTVNMYTTHLLHLAVRLHKVGHLHDLELMQPDRLAFVERLELLEGPTEADGVHAQVLAPGRWCQSSP